MVAWIHRHAVQGRLQRHAQVSMPVCMLFVCAFLCVVHMSWRRQRPTKRYNNQQRTCQPVLYLSPASQPEERSLPLTLTLPTTPSLLSLLSHLFTLTPRNKNPPQVCDTDPGVWGSADLRYEWTALYHPDLHCGRKAKCSRHATGTTSV